MATNAIAEMPHNAQEIRPMDDAIRRLRDGAFVGV